MRIALLGTRGIPASYSGFETCVEQLGQRLAQRGHQVTVYCRSHHIAYPGETYKGMRLIKLPTITNKYLDTMVHSFFSSLHALPQRYDIALYFIAGNSPVAWIPRLVGTKTILNVDGLDWKREKWPPLAKKYIQLAELLATRLPDAFITDSRVVQGYYQDRFHIEPPYIPYGSEVAPLSAGDALARYGVEPQKYILFVGRLVPENCAHHLVEAFGNLDTDFKCVIVGDAPYAEEYIGNLKASARSDPRIIFTGYVFGDGYRELASNSAMFVETSGVGGTHPALVEAMALGNCVVVHNTLENLETMGEAGVAYDGRIGAASLHQELQQLLSNPASVLEYRRRAQQRARDCYNWENVTNAYESLFYQVCSRPLPERLRQFEAGIGQAAQRASST
jgi:glycosyltransferase involved in cell wall biosynthesis